MNELDRITFNARVMGGKACIRNLRITVSLVLNLLSNEMATHEILSEYPDLEPEDIQQCLKYAAYLASDEVVTDTGITA